MTTTKKTWSTVIDTALLRDPDQGTYSLVIYNADDSEAQTINLDSVTNRAAKLEATAWITGQGWQPTGTWDDDVRRFRKAAS